MARQLAKNLLTFVLVLALTLGAVSLLSRVTSAKAQSASDRYVEQVRAARGSQGVTVMTAQVAEEGISPLVSAGAFLGVLAVSGGLVAVTLQGQRRARRQ